MEQWKKAGKNEGWLLPDYLRASAKSYSDWIGPALARHHQTSEVYQLSSTGCSEIVHHPSSWKMTILDSSKLQVQTDVEEELEQSVMDAIKELEPIPVTSSLEDKIAQQLNWQYEYQSATNHYSKQSVTEIKRQTEFFEREDGLQLAGVSGSKGIFDRPAFMQAKSLTSAEKGTIMHMIMQQIDLKQEVTEDTLEQLKLQLVQREFLRADQVEAVSNKEILQFFEKGLASRLRNAKTIYREVPFSMVIPAKEAYNDWNGDDEPVLIQGVIDCLFEDEEGFVLLDYKTDRIKGRFVNGFSEAKPVLEQRYKVQIALYTKAIEQILKIELKEKYLYFFDDGGRLLEM